MGLILCENKSIKNPFTINGLGIKVSSIEELCYVIMNYPLIALDELTGSRVVAFIRDEARPGAAGLTFARRFEDGMSDSEMLIGILGLCSYYSSTEIDKFKGRLIEIKTAPKYKNLKLKGDLIFKLHKYGQAIATYKNAITEASYQKVGTEFYAKAYFNIGVASVYMFDLDNAFDAFKTSYQYDKTTEALKYIYFISRQQPLKNKKEKYLSFVGDRVDPRWVKEYEDAVRASLESEKVLELEQNLTADSVKKGKYLNFTINTLKQNYRKML